MTLAHLLWLMLSTALCMRNSLVSSQGTQSLLLQSSSAIWPDSVPKDQTYVTLQMTDIASQGRLVTFTAKTNVSPNTKLRYWPAKILLCSISGSVQRCSEFDQQFEGTITAAYADRVIASAWSFSRRQTTRKFQLELTASLPIPLTGLTWSAIPDYGGVSKCVYTGIPTGLDENQVITAWVTMENGSPLEVKLDICTGKSHRTRGECRTFVGGFRYEVQAVSGQYYRACIVDPFDSLFYRGIHYEMHINLNLATPGKLI